MSDEANWHRIEHSGFTADLPVWLGLAERYGRTAIEVGSGCGRVALYLANRGIQITAVERNPSLVAALRASCAPGIDLNVHCGTVEELDSEVISRHQLVIFPLLVVHLICAEIGLEKGLGLVARLSQFCPRLAFSLMADLPSSYENKRPPRPSSLPASIVTRVEPRSELIELEHQRFSKTEVTTEIEQLGKVTVSDLSGAINRAPVEVIEIGSAEGVLGSTVAVF